MNISVNWQAFFQSINKSVKLTKNLLNICLEDACAIVEIFDANSMESKICNKDFGYARCLYVCNLWWNSL